MGIPQQQQGRLGDRASGRLGRERTRGKAVVASRRFMLIRLFQQATSSGIGARPEPHLDGSACGFNELRGLRSLVWLARRAQSPLNPTLARALCRAAKALAAWAPSDLCKSKPQQMV